MTLLALLLSMGVPGGLFASPGPAPVRGPGTADGPALYAEHCATCHGKGGGGDGPLAVDLVYKPRAFKEGKFAFGNTPDAMAKTVLSGIPGAEKARMPSFKSVLSEEEVKAVIDFVRTLMPEQPTLTASDMRMEVTDTAKIVRGILAPIDEGKERIPRGLLLGLPSGFSFEYATDDVRLLAVRRGDFVTRSDWEGRGGRPLTPLGTVFHEPILVAHFSGFSEEVTVQGHTTTRELRARLKRTSVQGKRAALVYELASDDGGAIAEVTETPVDEIVTGGAGFTRELAVRTLGGTRTLQFIAAVLPPELNRSGNRSELLEKDGTVRWLTVPRADGLYDCILLRTSQPVTGVFPVFIGLEMSWPATTFVGTHILLEAAPVVVRATMVTCHEVTPEALARMKKEIRP